MNMKNADMPAMPVDYNAKQGIALEGKLEVGSGLTKREIFAMNAMQGLLSRGAWSNKVSSIANDAVRHADALLAELEKMNGN